MKLKRITIHKIIIFVIHIFLCNIVFAQSEDSTKLAGQEHQWLRELGPVSTSFNFHSTIFDNQIYFNPTAPSLKLYPLISPSGETALFKSLTFRQSKTENTFPYLGGYEHYINSLIYNPGNDITLDVGFGLVKQNTIMSDGSNFQNSFHTSIEYAITSWLSAYLYGQYVSCPFNKPKDFFAPFLYQNPLFFQTETGGGLRATHKNIKADVGLKTIYDTQFNQTNPVNSMNTKVTIGF